MITEEDVRHYVVDQYVQDSQLNFGQEFSSLDIAEAMKAAARDYNTITPTIETVNPSALPDDTSLFLDAIFYHLIIKKIVCESRQEIEVVAGNTTTSPATTQIKRLQEAAKLYGDRFRGFAIQRKRDKNNRASFGRIG